MRKNKPAPLLSLLILLSTTCFCQTWTRQQLSSANTAGNVTYLTQAEKEAIMYLNLARMFPQNFVNYELINYSGPVEYNGYLNNSPYKASLITKLTSMQPVGVLVFDEKMYAYAKCFAKELYDENKMSHNRTNCAGGYFAECCSYGMNTGKDIAMQWLIDHDVSSLGHRTICLDKTYTKIGLSVHAHKEAKVCAVADIVGGAVTSNNSSNDASTNNNTGTSVAIDNNSNAYSNSPTNNKAKTTITDEDGNKPILRIVLDGSPNQKYYVFFSGKIYFYNDDSDKRVYLGTKQNPFFQSDNRYNLSWSFSINFTNATQKFTVSTDGNIYSLTSNNQFQKVGYITTNLGF